MTQYHEIITDAVTGDITEIIRDWTPEELAQQEIAKIAAKPTVSDLQAQLADIASQLQALQGSK